MKSDEQATCSRKLLDLLGDGEALIALFDPEDVLKYANAAFRKEFGVQAGHAPTWRELMSHAASIGKGTHIESEDVSTWLNGALSRRGKCRFRGFETDMRSGRWLWMTESLDDEGWMLCVATDITAIEQGGGERAMRMDRDIALRIARTDELTGTLNRRGILALFEDMSRQLPAEGRGYALCLIDLDHFKCINDRHGHEAGDLVLREFIDHALATVRSSDAVGRYGGEEFLMIFPDADAAGAAAILDRMRCTLPTVSLPEGGQDLDYSFSAGVLGVAGVHPVSELLRRVDRALYEAKAGGRGRTVTAIAA